MRGEFDFIHSLKSKYGLGHIGDDCAVLPKDHQSDLLVSADMLVEEIDFRLDWTTPQFLGHRSLAVSLSDIAAMGGTPKWAMLSIGVPEDLWKTNFLDEFYSGFHLLAEKHGVQLIGGDISRVKDKLVIDSMILGEVEAGRAVMRSGAKVGDAIFISGYIGGAAAGLELLERGQRLEASSSAPTRHLLLRQLQPLPQVETGKLLQEYKLPTAMIDLSDGLSSDLSHIVTASGAGARIDGELLPIDPAIAAVKGHSPEILEMALNGGEDFELLFTVDPEKIPIAQDLGFHNIGEITANTGKIELFDNGIASILEPRGFRHF